MNPNIKFQNAYQEINLYDSAKSKQKPIVTHSNGPLELAGMFANAQFSKEQEQVYMCAQPFYVGEVDHNIEEIGLMAVKEVRYVDEDEWEEMVRENEKIMKEVEKLKIQERNEIRKKHAVSRERNEKGQFVVHKVEKTKKVGKREKKTKNEISRDERKHNGRKSSSLKNASK